MSLDRMMLRQQMCHNSRKESLTSLNSIEHRKNQHSRAEDSGHKGQLTAVHHYAPSWFITQEWNGVVLYKFESGRPIQVAHSKRSLQRCHFSVEKSEVLVIRPHKTKTQTRTWLGLPGEGLVWLIGAVVCLLTAPPVELSVSAGNG